MWSAEQLEALRVFADERQAAGDPRGERVALSLARAETPAEDTARRTKLDQDIAALDEELERTDLAHNLRDFPQLLPSWDHGVLVGLRIVDHQVFGDAPKPFERVLIAVLARHAARFLRWVWIDTTRGSRLGALGMPEALADPRVLARPHCVIVGAPPRARLPRRRSAYGSPLAKRGGLALDRGLRVLYVDGIPQAMPWFEGRRRDRHRAVAQLALDTGDPIELTRFSRALHDLERDVRLAALERVLELDDLALARVLPELIRMQLGIPDERTRVAKLLEACRARPAVLDAAAREFTICESLTARWLASCGGSALALARERFDQMYALEQPHLGRYGEPRRHLALVQDELQRAKPRPPLLARLRRWWKSTEPA